MAKAVLPKKLTPATRIAPAAGRMIDAKTDEVQSFLAAALGGDVEGVHDLRVALRRLRETLRLFWPAVPRPRRRLMAQVIELNECLGRVRDHDVLADHVRALLQRAPEAASTLRPVLAAWAATRQRAWEEFADLWQRLAGRGRFLRRLRRLARATRKSRGGVADLSLDRLAQTAVLARLERVEQRLTAAQSGDDPAALHRVRLAVKRLKYTLEPFLRVFPSLASSYEVVSETQELLGLAHDLDVLEAALSEHFRGGRPAEAEPAFLALAAWREQAHAAARESLIALTDEAWRRGLLDALD